MWPDQQKRDKTHRPVVQHNIRKENQRTGIEDEEAIPVAEALSQPDEEKIEQRGVSISGDKISDY